MSNILVLPWYAILDGQQMWTERSAQHDAFILALCEPLKTACSNPAFFQDKMLQEHGNDYSLFTFLCLDITKKLLVICLYAKMCYI